MRSLQSILLGLLLALVGCASSDWGTATGTVSFKGQPMSKGMVTFEPVGGGASAYATITPTGAFSVMTGAKEGLKVGDYIVTVIEQSTPAYGEIAKILTPAKYASVTTSDLKATIKPGANHFEFKLTAD